MHFWKVVNTLAVRVVGLVSFLLHRNVNNLVLEILKNDKIWGEICVSVPHLQIMGNRPPFPMIYAHDCIRPIETSSLQLHQSKIKQFTQKAYAKINKYSGLHQCM